MDIPDMNGSGCRLFCSLMPFPSSVVFSCNSPSCLRMLQRVLILPMNHGVACCYNPVSQNPTDILSIAPDSVSVWDTSNHTLTACLCFLPSHWTLQYLLTLPASLTDTGQPVFQPGGYCSHFPRPQPMMYALLVLLLPAIFPPETIHPNIYYLLCFLFPFKK